MEKIVQVEFVGSRKKRILWSVCLLSEPDDESTYLYVIRFNTGLSIHWTMNLTRHIHKSFTPGAVRTESLESLFALTNVSLSTTYIHN
jgi:hypothetical protein